VKIKSNSQPSSSTLESKSDVKLQSSRQKNSYLEDVFPRRKEPSLSKQSPITIKLQQMKNQLLLGDRKKESKEINLKGKVGSSNFQFISINSVLSKENIISYRNDPRSDLSSRIKSDNIRKKINDIYQNRTPTIKVNEK